MQEGVGPSDVPVCVASESVLPPGDSSVCRLGVVVSSQVATEWASRTLRKDMLLSLAEGRWSAHALPTHLVHLSV